MTIEIPDQAFANSRISRADALLEIAVYLFKEEVVTLGRGAKLAGVSQAQFMKELALRKIPLHYDVEDFEQDLETLKTLWRADRK